MSNIGSTSRRTWISLGSAHSRSILALGATLVVVGWLLSTVPGTISEFSTRELGVTLLVATVAGIWIGARSVLLHPVTVVVVVTVAGAVLGRGAFIVGHRFGLTALGSELADLIIGLAVLVTTLAIGRARRSGPRPTDLLVAVAVWAFLMVDLRILQGSAFRDLGIYLRAGNDFVGGQSAYTTVPLTAIPADTAQFPFVYPPFTLPFFGLLAALPRTLVVAAWEIASLSSAILALRWFGVAWRWCPVLLLWPPFVEGIWVGNVAVPSLLFLAAASRAAWVLVFGPVFKLQFAVPALWILRERRWRDLAVGAGVLAGLALITLPLVGIRAWTTWVEALRAFQATEANIPAMAGAPLSIEISFPVYVTCAVVAIVIGLVAGGRRGLARLAVASVVASPSLYRHGLLPLLPGLLGLDELLLWVALGIVTNPTGLWLAVGLASIGTFWTHLPATPPTIHPAVAPVAPA